MFASVVYSVVTMQVEFEIPGLTPPSVNHYLNKRIWARRDGTPYIAVLQSPKAKAFKWAVAMYARGQSVAGDRKSRYRVSIDIYLGPRQRGDADNFAKVCLDGLQACGCIHSDANVVTCNITVHKHERHNPRTKFIVERLENESTR